MKLVLLAAAGIVGLGLLAQAGATSPTGPLPCNGHVSVLVGLGGADPLTVWWDDRDNGGRGDGQLNQNDWLYQETGVLAGLQSGGRQAVLLGYSDRCAWPVPAERDTLLY